MARECGDCSLCCKVMAVDEIAKPQGVWCQHFGRGIGCVIHATRPDACRQFVCQWIIDEVQGPEWKPSKCKMVLVADGPKLVVHVETGSPGPWRPPYLEALRRAAAAGLKLGEQVLVIEKGRTILILPEREVDFGVLAADERIVLIERKGPLGGVWDAVKMKADEAAAFTARVKKQSG